MFRMFNNNNERRLFGGSAFIEIQYCRLKCRTSVKKIVAVRSIENWKDDSLYVHIDDFEEFISNYGSIFNCGIYNNLQTGIIDIYGINYYSLEKVINLINIIEKEKPSDYPVLLNWLNSGLQYNGIYILGI